MLRVLQILFLVAVFAVSHAFFSTTDANSTEAEQAAAGWQMLS